MSCCAHACRVHYGTPNPGLFFHQGTPGAGMNPGMFRPVNQVPFTAMCADPSVGGQCGMQGGVHVLCPPQQGGPNAPTVVQMAGPCEAKSGKTGGSQFNPALEPWDDKGTKKHAMLCANPTPELGTLRSLPLPAAERCNPPPPPPRYRLPKLPGGPPAKGHKFGEPRGFPASSRCFPPRETYHYTTSKTYKLCYAK